jgi:membrane-bound metal-dependent hydrolase YbcI (DUF457 family)
LTKQRKISSPNIVEDISKDIVMDDVSHSLPSSSQSLLTPLQIETNPPAAPGACDHREILHSFAFDPRAYLPFNFTLDLKPYIDYLNRPLTGMQSIALVVFVGTMTFYIMRTTRLPTPHVVRYTKKLFLGLVKVEEFVMCRR